MTAPPQAALRFVPPPDEAGEREAATTPRRRADISARSRIVCGDALREMRKIRADNRFDVAIADPPYNIGKDFGNNGDNMPMAEYLAWSDEWIGECLRLTKPSAPVFVYGFAEILAHIAVRYPRENQKWLIWHYTNKTVPQSRFWQRSHEAILCLWRGARPNINIDAVREPYGDAYKKCAGKVRRETYCRYGAKGKKTVYKAHPKGALPRDVLCAPALAGGAGYVERWFYCKTCEGLFPSQETARHLEHQIIKHPTQKPLAICERLILSAADKGGEALIPFAGSGSECVAAQNIGADFFAAEINPDYVLLARERLRAGV
jgi:site-specific DNA-methyltransferase (adenine-specific)